MGSYMIIGNREDELVSPVLARGKAAGYDLGWAAGMGKMVIMGEAEDLVGLIKDRIVPLNTPIAIRPDGDGIQDENGNWITGDEALRIETEKIRKAYEILDGDRGVISDQEEINRRLKEGNGGS